MWNALKESDLFSVASVASRPALPFSFFPCLGLLFRVSFRFNFVSERQKKKATRAAAFFLRRPARLAHAPADTSRSAGRSTISHRSTVPWPVPVSTGFSSGFTGFYRVFTVFFCTSLEEFDRIECDCKTKTDWNEWFCWFPIARLLKRINELALFTGAAIKSGPTGFYRVLPGFYWVFPGFFVRAWKSLMVLNVAAKKNRLEWMVLLAFVC